MRNRLPTYPGRIRLTPVDGQPNVYDMVRADEPTEIGTVLNKSTLLTDAVAASMGLGADATPNDMFAQMQFLANNYVWQKLSAKNQLILETSAVGTNISIMGVSPESDVYYSNYAYGTGVSLNADGSVSLTGVFVPSAPPIYENRVYWTGLFPFYFQKDGLVYYVPSCSMDTYGYGLRAYEMYTKEVAANELIGYVNSPKPDAYPPEEDDGFLYEGGWFFGEKEVVIGTFTGKGSEGSSTTIDLGFRPKAVLVEASSGERASAYNPALSYGALFVDGFPMYTYESSSGTTKKRAEIIDIGFIVYNHMSMYGSANKPKVYIAFR